MYQLKLVLVILIFFLISPVVEAKKRCKPLLEKLHNIQASQRSGYSAKKGLSLRNREDKARNNWWQCENGSSKKNKKAKMQKKKKNKRKTVSANIKQKRIKGKKITAGKPFQTINAIVIKSKYTGEKKQAWLKYYQQPNQCVLPKSLSVFAFCSENRRIQQTDFDKIYSE
jgi:hypothetical protein